MNAYQLGRMHARGQIKEAVGFPKGPILPRLLNALGKSVRRGIWHLDPSLVPTMKARNLGAITAGLGLGTAGALMSDSTPTQPNPALIQQGYLPPPA